MSEKIINYSYYCAGYPNAPHFNSQTHAIEDAKVYNKEHQCSVLVYHVFVREELTPVSYQ